MFLFNLAVAFLPLIVCFFIFRHYSSYYPDIVKQLQSTVAGMIAALLVILISPVISFTGLPSSPFFTAFIKAALIEKSMIFVMLLIVFSNYSNISPLEGALSAMMAGFGFALVENTAFTLNYGSMAFTARVFYTVPMHISTCGILGCNIIQSKMSHSRLFKIHYLLTGILSVLFLHGLYDYLLIMDNNLMFLSSPLLLLSVFVFVIKLNRSRTVPGTDTIAMMGTGYEEWLHLGRQLNYDRWMRRSMGISAARSVPLLDWRPGAGQMLIIFLFFLISAAGGVQIDYIVQFFSVSRTEAQLVFIFFPFSTAIMIMIVNAVNPDFFKYRELKIPVISNIMTSTGSEFEENHVSYDITPTSIFINTYENLGKNKSADLEIEIPKLTVLKTSGTVIWEQHEPGKLPAGSLIRLSQPGFSFLFNIIIRYSLFRFTKGIIYNLRLPGFESVGKLFVHPISAMSNDRHYRKGEIIYREGETAGNFFFLKRGTVELHVKKNEDETILVNVISSGSIFGENTLFSPGKRSNTAIAKTESIISTADKSNLHILVRNNTEFAMQLFDTLARRIAETEQSLLSHIKEIEQKKMENYGLYHSLATIILLSLTGNDNRLEKSYPIDKIMKILQNLDDESSAELAMIIHSNAAGKNTDEAFSRLDSLFLSS